MNLPIIQFKQYDGLFDPSGSRNLDVAASGWVKNLDTSSSGVLNYGFINTTTTGALAGTKLILFRPLTMGDAQEIFNFRFWLSNVSAWGTGTYAFKWHKSIGFISGLQLDGVSNNIPTSLPVQKNVLSSHSGTFIQNNSESGCSEYIYLDIYADTDVPVDNYGGPGAGNFRYRLTYDFI